MNIKKIVSLLLALAMVIGMVTPPSQAYAKENSKEFVEADYKVENVDGKYYKVYEFTDLFGTNDTNDEMNIGGLDISEPITLQAVGASNPALGDEINLSVEVVWTTYDLAPGELGTPVYFQIYDKTSKKIIAKTENVTVKSDSKSYKFHKLPAWDESDVSHDKNNWQLRAPNEYRFDVRLRTSTQGHAAQETLKAVISQRSMPIYRAEYYTNKTIPTIKAQRTNKFDDTDEVPINSENLTGDQYYSWAKAISDQQKPFFEGRLLDIQKYGSDTLASLQISDDITSGRVKMAMKAPGKTDFDRGPGTFTDNGTPYHYEVTGDYLHLHIFTIRQDLTVKFDANKGTWKTQAPADQTIGHSMKLGDSWAGLGPITVPGESALTPPAPTGTEKEKKFIGWNTDANATTALFTDNTYAEPITKDETFYAIYVEKPQGKVNVKYLEFVNGGQNTEITDAKYKYISDKAGEDEVKDGETTRKLTLAEKYPAEKLGNKGEIIKADLLKTTAAPTFIGYKIKQVKTDPVPQSSTDTANYTENGQYTIQYIYEKLDPIIPAKDDNGNDNPKATEDVKATYKSVTIKVDTNKGQFKKSGAVKTESQFVYFVNPVEGKTLDNVLTESGLTAESKDANVYKIDTTKWTFNPAKTKANADVSTSTEVTNTNFDQKNIDMEVNFVQTKADQLKDKLEAVDIRVWVDTTDTDGSKITWKNGVKLNDANKDNETLKSLLAGATVTDLGENGTLAQEGTKRNSSKQNLPDGKKGTLKVAFNDGSALVVENQMLYVAPEKNVVKEGEPNQINPDKLPEGNIAVAFRLGKGVKIGTKEGNETNPVLYETYYVKSGTSLEARDIPTTEVLNNNYKNNKWYNGNVKLAEADYTNITAAKTFVAKADEKGKGTVKIEYWADGNKLDSIEAYKLPGKTYIIEKKGTEDADVKVADLTADYFDLLGYEKDTTKGTQGIEVEANTKYLTANQKTVKFNYKKIDDIVGPVTPGTTKPAGYVTIMFKADADNQNPARGNFGTNIQDVVYYVNPKTVTIDKKEQKLSGMNKENQEINKDFPTLTVTDNKFVANKKNAQGNYDASGTQQWLVNPTNGIVNNKLAQTITESDTLTLTAMYLGKFNVTYKVVVLPQGKELPAPLKALTAAYDNNAKDRTNLDPGTQYDTPQNIDINILNEDAKKALIEEKDGKKVGEWTLQNWVKTEDNSGNVTFTLTWTFTEAGKPAPQPEQPPMPDYNPWWPIWFGSTKTEVKKEEPKHLERHDAYISGYPDGTVRPDGKITRAEVSAIFARLTESSAPANYSPKFSDVLAYDWFCDSVMKLSNKDIIKGYPDGTFKPNKSITRAEFAVIASKYIKNPKTADETFSDVPMNHWAKDAIAMVKAEGWISGYTDGTFKPDAPITRAEAVSIVNRMFDRAADGEFVREHGFEITKFGDLNSNHWAYYEMIEATHSHDYERIDKRTERWEKIVK